ncbi:hypothetical protein HYPSUDRAFT_53475 [Hypholoma sublateritium FD-334 SS-4]|uniref:Uncharacterized protein n=1 Tax=Hypholoma sublateritium (strain FD-334 SS-4) TaxID=945553 RepID=A0A0D2P8K1_HYPSF|nr:hypothetical protein HYPSUDRAFT_53475 [Hypholoma sublateritium FD-334 SS-4]
MSDYLTSALSTVFAILRLVLALFATGIYSSGDRRFFCKNSKLRNDDAILRNPETCAKEDQDGDVVLAQIFPIGESLLTLLPAATEDGANRRTNASPIDEEVRWKDGKKRERGGSCWQLSAPSTSNLRDTGGLVVVKLNLSSLSQSVSIPSPSTNWPSYLL